MTLVERDVLGLRAGWRGSSSWGRLHAVRTGLTRTGLGRMGLGRLRMYWLGALGVLAVGCGGEGGGDEEAPEPSAAPSVVSAAPVLAVEPGDGTSRTVSPEPTSVSPSQFVDPPLPPVVEPEIDFDDPIAGPAGPPCDAVENVFKVSCAVGGSCHVGAGIGDFAVGAEQARKFVGKTPNLNSRSCGLMIDPDNPFESLILTKVTGEYPYDSSECRTLMPPPFGGVTDGQIACLESWLWQFRR